MADHRPPRKPDWLRIKLPGGETARRVASVLRKYDLPTICHAGQCPNRGECFAHRHLTFMLLGENCTRNCAFCGVAHKAPSPPDPAEPERIAAAVRELQLRYVVLTSVTRDDLSDGGAGHWHRTVRTIRENCPGVPVETLIPDFGGNPQRIARVASAGPDIMAHNIEMVPRLYPALRRTADYRRSLAVVQAIAGVGLTPKSGLMLGLGETDDEVVALLNDLYVAGCRLLTIGQYLAPARDSVPVTRYVTPEEFDAWRDRALAMGFADVIAGPLVRSSYRPPR